MNQLIRCVNCDAIHLKTPFDQQAEYGFCLNGFFESFRSFEKDDFLDFLETHRGHRLEDLEILEDSFVSEKTYFEPVKISYFKATNGKEKFLIKKFRDKIDEPLKYQLIFGDYSLKCIRIEIQSEEIVKQLKAEFKKGYLSQTQIDTFLRLYQHIAEIVDIKNLERVSEESPFSLEVYYKIDDISLVYLLRNCRNIFKGQEYLDIEEFIHRHKDEGVLLLKATYKIQISEKAKSEKKATSASIPFEMEKIVEKKKL